MVSVKIRLRIISKKYAVDAIHLSTKSIFLPMVFTETNRQRLWTNDAHLDDTKVEAIKLDYNRFV